MAGAPLVSILIPCYNAAPWLRQTIESALSQTWPHVEVIVIDDGSTDGSRAIAAEYGSRGLRVLHETNRGAAAARNAGLKSAHGDYIQYLDADDLLAPDKIAAQMDRLLSRDASCVGSAMWARFLSDPSEAVFVPHENSRDMPGVEFLQLHYETRGMMHPAAWLAPRPLLDRAGPWNERLTLNDDGEYFARVVLAAGEILFCPAARVFYRSGVPGSLSARKDRAAFESLFRACELTTSHLLARDRSARSLKAVAHAWRWVAFELHPSAPDLSRLADARCREHGGSKGAFPGGKRFQLASKVIGWRLAKRLLS